VRISTGAMADLPSGHALQVCQASGVVAGRRAVDAR
jgi:hypothetical protein